MKLLKGKFALLALGLVVGMGGTAAAAFSGVLPFANKAAAATATPVAQVRGAVPKTGMMLPLKERVVNLADQGAMRYLKTGVVLEVVDYSGASAAKGAEYKKKQEELVKEMGGQIPVIEDQITSVLTSKSVAQIATVEGKDKLKDEIRVKVNQALGHNEVLGVYFSEFVIQ